MLYFIADPHFGHKRSIYEHNRPYRNVNKMDNDIKNKWNHTVKKEDTIIVQGDVSFRSGQETKELIQSLNGHKKLIRGNHDFGVTHKKWLEYGFEESLVKGKNKQDYYLLKKDGITVALSHYPIEDCPYFNIHGHVHEDLTGLNQKKYLCVSVEQIGYTPISWEKVKTIMHERGVI